MTSRLALGGRQSQLGLVPDLTTLGKYFGGGMSFGAFGGRRERDAALRPAPARCAGPRRHLQQQRADDGRRPGRPARAVDTGGDRDAESPRRALRERCNALFAARGLALQFTGLGSLMNLHATSRPVRRPADLAGSDARIKDLLFFALLERGVFMARRGLVALSLPFGDAECEQFAGRAGRRAGGPPRCAGPRRAERAALLQARRERDCSRASSMNSAAAGFSPEPRRHTRPTSTRRYLVAQAAHFHMLGIERPRPVEEVGQHRDAGAGADQRTHRLQRRGAQDDARLQLVACPHAASSARRCGRPRARSGRRRRIRPA